MAKDLYCVILKGLGKKPDRALEELSAYGTADSDLEAIKEKIENGKTVNIAYCESFKESKLLKERFEACGALVDVSTARSKKNKKAEIEGTPFYDSLCEGFENYTAMRKTLHKNLSFGVIGWPLLAIGISFLVFKNLWGLIALIIGIIILDISAFMLMLSNNKKKKAEKAADTDPEIISTGKKVWLVVLEILKCIGVILFGAFVVLYRIINNLWRLHKIKHGYGLVMPFTETAGFDALISVGIFLLFFLITYICVLIAK